AGAIINYYLKAKPKGPLTLEVRDSQGGLVDLFKSKKKADKDKDKEATSSNPMEKVETPKVLPKEEEEESPESDPDAPDERYKRLELKTEAGVNRVVWDLRYKGA